MTTPTSPLASSLAALCAVSRSHQISADPAALALQLGSPAHEALDPETLVRAAQHLGLTAKWTPMFADRLARTPLPALALLESADGALRTVTVTWCDGKRLLFQEGTDGKPTSAFVQDFDRQWTGELLLFSRRTSLWDLLARFDFSRFVPAFAKCSKLHG